MVVGGLMARCVLQLLPPLVIRLFEVPNLTLRTAVVALRQTLSDRVKIVISEDPQRRERGQVLSGVRHIIAQLSHQNKSSNSEHHPA
jgi:hypothetical protein